MTGAGLEGTQPTDLSQRIAQLTQILDAESLYGPVYQNVGLPSAITLVDSDPDWGYGAERGNIRVRKGKGGLLFVYGMNPYDYGMGMDTMWFAWEQYKVGMDGKVTLQREGWPNQEMYVREFFGEVPLEEKLPLAEAERVVAELSQTVEAAAKLKAEGRLQTAAREISEAHQRAFDRVHNPHLRYSSGAIYPEDYSL